MKKSKFTLLLLAFAILTVLLVISSFAETVSSGPCGADLTYTLDDTGTLTISGTGNMTNYSYNSAPWYTVRNLITNILISDGVTSVGANAFNECKNLSDISIPNTVTVIGASAFRSCESIVSITVPDSVTEICEGAFQYCTNIKVLTLPKDIYGEGIASRFGHIFGYVTKKDTTYYGSYLKTHTFNGMYLYPEVFYPEINTDYTDGSNVPAEAVYQNYSYLSTSSSVDKSNTDRVLCYSHRIYTYYTIPESLKIVKITNDDCINSSAFYNCSNIEEIVLYEKTEVIEEDAFFGCLSLENVKVYNPSIETYEDIPISNVTMLQYGDISGDGTVDVSDVIKILQLLASGDLSGLAENQETAADVNGDGNVDISDVIRILQYLASPGSSLNPNI